jgi:hypothetical protein
MLSVLPKLGTTPPMLLQIGWTGNCKATPWWPESVMLTRIEWEKYVQRSTLNNSMD